jgi:membrane protein YqaA with SNARE-associated domain
MTLRWMALLWGFAEATVFFIVPDVLLSFVALRDLRKALVACGLAVLGALTGGTLMYLLSAHDHDPTAYVVEKVPAIGHTLIGQVRDQMRDRGPIAVTIGPFIGWPYKVYAIEAREAGISLPVFAAITVPARLSRFLLVTVLTGIVSRALERRVALRWRSAVLGVVWIAVYTQYWSSMEW